MANTLINTIYLESLYSNRTVNFIYGCSTHSDDQQDLITLVVLCCMPGIRHCLVQDWGEIGWSIEIQLINSIVVSIQYTLH